MNTSDYGQPRPRGLPNGTPALPGARPVYDQRNGINPSASSIPNGGRPQSTQTSRAEKFEDEKRRLIESCFNKKETDGKCRHCYSEIGILRWLIIVVSESYITHMRIEEDAAYPSSPPPAQSPPDNKKSRVIVVAVRKSGRVRMHKARENVNGTFSIGKTWVLDDLTMIESFTNAVPTTSEEQQNKQRAGSVGFTVTIQKPYYWQAATAKEKDYFIFSLIKIFKKYTGGRLPDLQGFSQAEIDQLGNVGSNSSAPSQAARMPSQEPTNFRQPRQLATPDSARDDRSRPPQERPAQDRGLYGAPGQEPTRTLHSAAPQERQLRSTSSNDRIYMPGAFPSTDSIDHSPQPSQLRSKRSQSPGSQSAVSQQSNYRRGEGHQLPESLRSGPDKTLGYRPSNEPLRPNGSVPPVLRAGSADTGSSTPPLDRPATATSSKDAGSRDPTHRDPGSIDPYGSRTSEEDQRPPPLTSRSYQRPVAAAEKPIIKSTARAPSAASRRAPEKGPDPILKDPSESSGEPLNEDTRPTTAASQNGYFEQTAASKAGFASSIPDRDDKPSPAVSAIIPTPTPTPPPPETPTETEGYRPGLGPMIKKKSTKEIASQFRKAATAANAFKARPGGAGDKVQKESSSGGDGITGVFQAPSLLRGISQDDYSPVTPKEAFISRPATPQKPETPAVQISVSPVKEPELERDPKPQIHEPPPEPSKEITTEERRKRRRSDHSAKYARTLGIQPSLLEGRTFELEDVLNTFGWNDGRNDKMMFEELESGIRKELAYVEAGSWLGAVENNDDRAVAVGEMMDKVMAECEELDCLLTLYNVELGVSDSQSLYLDLTDCVQTLTEDVAYIEAQSQGLQVQTANQKLLQTELKNLIDTISISPEELKVLRDAKLDRSEGIQQIEHTLAQLYAAMLTIDPKMARSGARSLLGDHNDLHRKSGVGFEGSELSSMLAVQEKRDGFNRDSVHFIYRLKQYLSIKFRETEAETLNALERKKALRTSDETALDPRLREEPKASLWIYSPLLLFVRETEQSEWDDLLRMYEGCAKKPYQDEFRDNLSAWRKLTRKPAGDEQDVLFTSQEKESDSLVGRKLTVKRTKTVRSDGPTRISGAERPNDGKATAYEAFAGALTETAKMIFVEQNFIIEIFHTTSLNAQDFIDAIGSRPDQRRGGDLLVKKPFDPDRDMARKLLGVMEDVFSFWPSEIQSLVDWAVKRDVLNTIGVLFALESQLSEIEETNQEFLSQAVSKIHDRLAMQFTRFVEEQVRGIEDTMVKIKKRKGIVTFIKIFPNFCATVENMLPPTRSLDHLPIRGMVNDAYQSINKAMFGSLRFIAKESPTATTGATSGDPEDKEALNNHILFIENMNHYVEEVPVRNNPVLEDWNFRARAEMSEHMNAYLSAVIRRPLGKLLDFLESTESLIKNLPPSQPPSSIATRASHSRSVFKKLLGSYDSKELRRGAETLRKRVEKHFADADDATPGLGRELIAKVLKECEARYTDIMNRVDRLISDVYEGCLELDWRRDDVVAGFRG